MSFANTRFDLEKKACPAAAIRNSPVLKKKAASDEKDLLKNRNQASYGRELIELNRLKLKKELEEERKKLAQLLEMKMKMNGFLARLFKTCLNARLFGETNSNDRSKNQITDQHHEVQMILNRFFNKNSMTWQQLRHRTLAHSLRHHERNHQPYDLRI